MSNIGGNKSSLIYHYTSPAGLIGMIESNSLWATHVNYLNDSQEYIYGSEIFSASLNDSLTRIEELRQKTIDTFCDDLKKYRPMMSDDEVKDCLKFNYADLIEWFVVCFSKIGDQLSQWRGYALDGAGFSVGFDQQELNEVIRDTPAFGQSILSLREVDYDILSQKTKMKLITDVIVLYLLDPSVMRGHEHLMFDAAFEICSYKHPSFFEEQEVRFIVRRDERKAVKTRVSGSKLTPYLVLEPEGEPNFIENGDDYTVSIPKVKLPIREIICGPRVDVQKAGWAIRNLLDAQGYSHDAVRIVGSKIPYI
jgi:hypothetical protein